MASTPSSKANADQSMGTFHVAKGAQLIFGGRVFVLRLK